MKKSATILMTGLVAAHAACAATTEQKKVYTDGGTKPPPQQTDEFKWGGDFRFRSVYFDNIPYANVPAEARGGANSFQRYRTRIFGEYHPREDLYFRGRIVNEFRTTQNDGKNSWAPFDETLIDNLYVDFKNELFDVRIGRQDLIYGTGKLILDGTPLDGSRTIYFDAAKLTYKGIENTAVDFLAMYTEAKNPLVLHSQDRDLNGYAGPAAPYEGAEAGGGVYIKNKTHENLPWEAYWLIKTEQQFLDDEINTVGTRLMPKLNDAFDASVELAYQSSAETSEFMVDAFAKWHIQGMEEQKTTLGLGWYHLSEDWNPMFARWPQYSELYVYSFDTTGAAQWKNVSMPHIDFSISPCKGLKSDLLLGYMFAPEDDGLGDGHNRGLLFTWWNRFTIREKLFSDHDKLTGHVLFELVNPGDYYTDAQQNNTATFTRVELSYAF